MNKLYIDIEKAIVFLVAIGEIDNEILSDKDTDEIRFADLIALVNCDDENNYQMVGDKQTIKVLSEEESANFDCVFPEGAGDTHYVYGETWYCFETN